MRVIVEDGCVGHGRCWEIAPEIFELDEFGLAHTDGTKDVPAELEDRVRKAARACPERIISVIEKQA